MEHVSPAITEFALRECERERAELRADAERYRWIRDQASLTDEAYCELGSVFMWDTSKPGQLNERFHSLDAAIDAAMKASHAAKVAP